MEINSMFQIFTYRWCGFLFLSVTIACCVYDVGPMCIGARCVWMRHEQHQGHTHNIYICVGLHKEFELLSNTRFIKPLLDTCWPSFNPWTWKFNPQNICLEKSAFFAKKISRLKGSKLQPTMHFTTQNRTKPRICEADTEDFNCSLNMVEASKLQPESLLRTRRPKIYSGIPHNGFAGRHIIPLPYVSASIHVYL